MDAWNIRTLIWLRRTVYERAPMYNTMAVFTVSAFWHGFYPGYYVGFLTAAIFIFANRTVGWMYSLCLQQLCLWFGHFSPETQFPHIPMNLSKYLLERQTNLLSIKGVMQANVDLYYINFIYCYLLLFYLLPVINLWLVVDRVLGPVLGQGSTATGSLTLRVKPERLAWQNGNNN